MLQPSSTRTYIRYGEFFRPHLRYDVVLTRLWLSGNGPMRASDGLITYHTLMAVL